MGVCPQHDVLFELLTPEEHLDIFYDFKGGDPALKEEEIGGLIVDVGVSADKKKVSGSLSGGNRRKLSVAIALCGNSRLVMLDEPTAGVDAESQQRISETFGSLHDRGRTVVLVTHELGPFASLASRIIVLGSPRGETSTVLYDGPPPVPDHLHERVWHHSEDVVMRATEPGVLEPGAG